MRAEAVEHPPYFNIDPDRAAADLGGSAATARFAEIAAACARGREDLASRGLNPEGKRELRLFSTWEITKYLIPVAPAHFRRVLRQNPDLPQGRSDTEGGAKWFTLDEVLIPAVKDFTYEYDFGDSWQHDVSVQERVVADDERNGWPMCLAGANACPPEDVGGISGYGEFLQAMSDPSHEEHDAMWRWWGGPFDPRGFDINAANRGIRMWLTTSP